MMEKAKEICDFLITKRLGYTSSKQFVKQNSNSLTLLNKNGELDERIVLLAHYMTFLQTIKPEFSISEKPNSKKFLRKFMASISRMNKNLKEGDSQKQYRLKLLYNHVVDQTILIIAELNLTKIEEKPRRFSKQNNAKHMVEKFKNVVVFFPILYDSKSGDLKIFFKNERFRRWLLSLLRVEEKTTLLDAPWTDRFDDLLRPEGCEITEIAFSRTDVNQRDRIILRPTDPKSLPYLVEKLVNVKVIKNPDISYIERMKVRLPGGHTYSLLFQKPNDVSIRPIIQSSSINYSEVVNTLYSRLKLNPTEVLIDSTKDFLGEIFDDIGVRKLILKRDVEKYRSYAVLQEFENNEIVKLKSLFSNKCSSAICKGKTYLSPKISRRCSHCKMIGHIYWTEFKAVSPRYAHIRKILVELLKNNNLMAKGLTTKVYSKKYELILTSYNEQEAYILFNEKGISKRIMEDFLIDNRPLVIANFVGELTGILPYAAHMSGGCILRSLKNEDVTELQNELKLAVSNFKSSRLESLKTSLIKLKEIRDKNINSDLTPAEKGQRFERLIRPLFSMLFYAKPLGSRSKPDGVFFINDSDYVIWDSKRYDSPHSKLLAHMNKRHNDAPKDIDYIRRAVTFDRILKRNLKYYLFITKGISPQDFVRSELILSKHKKKHKLKTKIVCMDLNGLIVLGDGLTNPAILEHIEKDRSKFTAEFTHILNAKDFITDKDMVGLVEKFKNSPTDDKMTKDSFTVT